MHAENLIGNCRQKLFERKISKINWLLRDLSENKENYKQKLNERVNRQAKMKKRGNDTGDERKKERNHNECVCVRIMYHLPNVL